MITKQETKMMTQDGRKQVILLIYKIIDCFDAKRILKIIIV